MLVSGTEENRRACVINNQPSRKSHSRSDSEQTRKRSAPERTRTRSVETRAVHELSLIHRVSQSGAWVTDPRSMLFYAVTNRSFDAVDCVVGTFFIGLFFTI